MVKKSKSLPGRIVKIQSPILTTFEFGENDPDDSFISPNRVKKELEKPLYNLRNVFGDSHKFSILALDKGHDIYVVSDGTPYIENFYESLIDVFGLSDFFWQESLKMIDSIVTKHIESIINASKPL